MFFGLQVKTNQNQAKPMTFDTSVKLSQAVLDPATKNGKKEPVSLVAEYDNKQFILCVIDPAHSWQSPLDLMFEGGSEVKFFVRGSGTVHLTGYENFDDLDSMSLDMSSDEELELSDSDGPAPAKQIAIKKSPKATKGPEKTNGFKGPSKKKAVKEEVEDNDEDDDDDDSDYEASPVLGDDSDDEEDDEDDGDDDADDVDIDDSDDADIMFDEEDDDDDDDDEED